MYARHSLVLMLALTAGLAAQDPIVKRSLKNSTTGLDEVTRSMLSNQKSIAVTADGRIWCLAHWEDGSWDKKNNLDPQRDASRHLLLQVSTDGGQSWSTATEARTTGDHYGSFVTDPDGYTLHVSWYAWNGKKTTSNWYNSVFYATYDTRTNKWNGTDTLLVAGSDPSAQTYSSPDIAITDSGVVGVVFACARGVPSGWVGTGGSWNSGLLWRKNGKWSAPYRLNADSTGVGANIHAQGDYFHSCYRVATGGYGIEYRRFDTVAEKLETEMPIVPNPSNPKRNASNVRANNISHVAVLDNGDLYILYGMATSSSGGGKLFYVFKPDGKPFQTPIQIDDDSKMGWGNNTYRFYDLAMDEGGSISAIYSKLVESNQNLYSRVLTPTKTIPPYPSPAIKLRTGTAANQFTPFVCGHRTVRGLHALYASYTDLVPVGPFTGGVVRFLGSVAGSVVFKGLGCNGALKDTPVLASSSLPKGGQTMSLEARMHPAKTAAVLFLGLDDTKLLGAVPLPLELKALGMPSCFLSQDIPFAIPYPVDAQGSATIPIPLPNDPKLLGVPLFWQSFVAAPTANAANALLTNGLATIAR